MTTLSLRSRMTSSSIFLPAGHRLFDQHLVDQAVLQAQARDPLEFLAVVRDAAAGAAQGEGRADDDRVADFFGDSPAPSSRLRATWLLGRSRPMPLAWLCLNFSRSSASVDGVDLQRRSFPRCIFRECRGSKAFTAVFRPVCPPKVGSRASGRSFSMILSHDLRGDGLDVGPVGHLRVGHDGGGVGIDQHDLDNPSRAGLCRPGSRNNRIRRPGR